MRRSLVLLLLAATLGTPAAVRAAEPIKIGVLVPLSGVFAPNGQHTLDGIRLYLDEVKPVIGGRPITLLVVDGEGKPDVSLTKAQKLVERDRVHLLTGISSSAVAYAIRDYVDRHKIPLIISADAGAEGLTKPGSVSPYIFRLTHNANMPSYPMADWAARNNLKKIALLYADFAAGVEIAAGFTRALCDAGGQVVQAIPVPLAAVDFAPYLAGIDAAAQAVAVFTPGAPGLRLGRQYAEYGLKEKMPLLDIFGQVTFEPNLEQLGAAGEGIVSSLDYSTELATPENRAFVKAFEAKYAKLPIVNAATGYGAMQAIVETLKQINGHVEDVPQFLARMKATNLVTPRGRVRLDEYQNVVENVYIRRVQKVGGQYRNVVIQTYPDVTQFWTWGPERFMKFAPFKDAMGKLTTCASAFSGK
jgi:branched-chain amino acid transport system substrate-binding protein